MRPLLLGGCNAPRLKSLPGWIVHTWLPVAVMLAIIARESTSMFSAGNTSGWMRALYQAVCGRVPDRQWPGIEYGIRKCGHFIGYGVLGLAWLRAWMIVWRGWPRLRSLRVWRTHSVSMALACTAVVASLDELHQSFLPDRSGVPADVLLDCAGAATLMLVCAISWIRSRGGSAYRDMPSSSRRLP